MGVNGGASATEPIRREKLCRKQREQRRKLKLKKTSTSEHLSAEISVPGVERDGRIPIALTKGTRLLMLGGLKRNGFSFTPVHHALRIFQSARKAVDVRQVALAWKRALPVALKLREVEKPGFGGLRSEC
jgi:hypothetical protein